MVNEPKMPQRATPLTRQINCAAPARSESPARSHPDWETANLPNDGRVFVGGADSLLLYRPAPLGRREGKPAESQRLQTTHNPIELS
jgi:hypothetical protein